MTQSPAQLWTPGENKTALCRLCRHGCRLAPGQRGICGVRGNEDGTMYTLTANRIAALNLDPVEKKPLYHFLPGTRTLSFGTEGCNFACEFCQNHTLSQDIRKARREARGQAVTPEMLVQAALENKASSLSYTYSEPTIFFELLMGTATLAQKKGLKGILVSNAYESRACLDALHPVIHAANFDLKAFSDDFYKQVCGARLRPVLDTLVYARGLGWWLELTTLLIPGVNDDEKELTNLAEFIHAELGAETPWHISRYHPEYFFRAPATSTERLERAAEIGKNAGLRYVYIGNLPGHPGNHTYCPTCGRRLVRREGFSVALPASAACPDCDTTLPGVGWPE